LGNLFSGQTNFVAAIRQYERALRINPNYVEVQNNLAWILATCPDAAFRDGPRAVALARSSDRLSRGTLAPVLDTLAAAYAEAGQYPEAVATARRALAVAAGQESVADGLRARLRLYEAGIPYHETREAP
jgi:tetratricopeptide (TPR) repeat protein